MNRYLIQHKIKTLAHLYDQEKKFEFQGFKFRNWDFTITHGCQGDAWIAEKTIEAEDPEQAINKFEQELLPIVERLAFVSQCYFSYIYEPFFIYKENAARILFIWFSEETRGVPLHFDEDEIKSFEKLDEYKAQPVFTYLQESTHALTHLGKLTMLIKALESMAGQITKVENCDNCRKERSRSATDSDMLKKILGDENLYKKIFGSGGIRHKLSHGNAVKLDDNYPEKIYDAIVKYFNTTHGTTINTDVVNPQRHFHGHYTVGKGWYQIKSPSVQIELKELTELVKKHFHTGHIIRPNGELDIVSKPENY